MIKQSGSSFRRERMPDPSAYFARLDFRLAGRGRWRSTRCPFHDDTNPSLRIDIETGAWRCMACGEHGGDVIAFERRYYGHSFREACERLGCWG